MNLESSDNPIEKLKAEKDGLDILAEIEELARAHSGWETMDPGDRERLKWIGTFFRKPTPGLFMMRVRITNGRTTSRQLRALATISQKIGNGVLDLTTRQQIQLRAIAVRNVPEIFQKLRDVDLTSLQTGMDNIRNVNTCPVAGLTHSELFDASPISAEFTREFLANRAFTNLPRKFNVTITGCTENCTHAASQDIAMVPAVREETGEHGLNVFVGGKMGSGGMTVAQPLDAFVALGEAAALCREITLLFRDAGPRASRQKARLAFLIEDWGIAKFRRVLEERRGSPLAPSGLDARLPWKGDHLGVHSQRQAGLYYAGLCIPTGRVRAEQLEELARLAEDYGSGEVRLTTDQNAILANLAEEKIPRLLDEPLLREFPPDPHPLVRGLVTCTGTDYCNLALIETKTHGLELAQALARRLGANVKPLTFHWSGCAAGCGNHQASDIGFKGIKARVNDQIVDAVEIYVGGRTGPDASPGKKIIGPVPVAMLPQLIPIVIENLDLLERLRWDEETEGRVVMVPVEEVLA